MLSRDCREHRILLVYDTARSRAVAAANGGCAAVRGLVRDAAAASEALSDAAMGVKPLRVLRPRP